VVQSGKGIYRIDGMLFPMQIVVTRELDRALHVWLKSLTRSMDVAQAEELLENYGRLQDDGDRAKASVVINLVSDINNAVFIQIVSGGERMSEELKEMILPELGEVKRLLAESRTELADRDAKLADKDAELADKDAKLADKDAEIAELKRLLAEKES
ncbi:MAG: hypothetical protein K2I96_22925, partial [Lachnospiraceae bacterium]|nr:hypothetical protein [Lachnospiraceae bacterium]